MENLASELTSLIDNVAIAHKELLLLIGFPYRNDVVLDIRPIHTAHILSIEVVIK
jgi:hypothetical protein